MNSRLMFFFAIALAAQAQSYTITDLHPGTDVESRAWAINRLGDVAGVFAQRAFLWRQETGLQDLGTPAGFNGSIAYGLNDLGQVAGCSQTCGRGGCLDGRAFVHSGGNFIDLGAGNMSCARAINQSGQAVGISTTAWGRAFFWTGTALVYLFNEQTDTVDIYESEARAINDAGQIAGMRIMSTWSSECYQSPYPPCHLIDITTPFVWQNGVTRAVDFSQNAGSTAINSLGEAAGSFRTNDTQHAFLWRGNVVTDLGTLPDHNLSSAFGINASGDVVGFAAKCEQFVCSEQRAFLYHAGSMVDLNTLIPEGTGWVLTYATAINDAGQIVGFGRKNGQGTDRAFLLIPSVDGP